MTVILVCLVDEIAMVTKFLLFLRDVHDLSWQYLSMVVAILPVALACLPYNQTS